MESVVEVWIEAGKAAGNGSFPEPALEMGGAQDFNDNEDRDQCNEPRPVGDERIEDLY